MLSLAFTLLLLAAQPDDGPVATQQVVPPPSTAAFEEAKRKADEQKKKDEAAAEVRRKAWAEMWKPPPTPPPPTVEDLQAQANRAALERAEQAGRDANAPPGAWPDEGKMRCKQTDNGFVCGNSEEALQDGSPSRKALDEIMKPN